LVWEQKLYSVVIVPPGVISKTVPQPKAPLIQFVGEVPPLRVVPYRFPFVA
jgi:hypothetical protein